MSPKRRSYRAKKNLPGADEQFWKVIILNKKEEETGRKVQDVRDTADPSDDP